MFNPARCGTLRIDRRLHDRDFFADGISNGVVVSRVEAEYVQGVIDPAVKIAGAITDGIKALDRLAVLIQALMIDVDLATSGVR